MDNAGFFAAGVEYQLPHPSIHTGVLVVTHNALRRAFALLRNTDFSLGTAHEDQVTQQLHWILEDRLRQTGEVPGFDERIFRKVWRAPEVTNFDGEHPAKKPDLVFEIVRDETLVLSSQGRSVRRMQIGGKDTSRWNRLLQIRHFAVHRRRLCLGDAGSHDARLCTPWLHDTRQFATRLVESGLP